MPRDMADRLRVLADYHGRSLSAEIRHAIAIFDNLATDASIHTDAARAELGSEEQFEEAKRRLTADRDELWRAAFRAPRVLPVTKN